MGAQISQFFGPQPDEPEFRSIQVARGGYSFSQEQAAIPDNSINTSKYNLVTFLPRSLFEQFRRAANIYFLVISVLMLVGTYTSLFDSPLAPFSTLMPLIMVLVITMGKEGMEDLKRHRSDNMVNNKRMATVLSTSAPGQYETVPWRAVQVGSIVQVLSGDEIPADLILLTSSEANGVAYVETSNIDGETNLKIRSSAPTRPELPAGPMWSSAEELYNLSMGLEYERPNPRIHFFTGTLKIEEGGGNGSPVTRTVPVDQANMLLRGSSLKNTRWALGLVVYTGKETKIVKNARRAPSKRSNVDRVTNRIMGIIFAAMAFITTATLIGYGIFKAVRQSQLYYLCFDRSKAPLPLFRENCVQEATGADILLWFTFLILYNNFIPISLYVTLEIVNAVQADYIDQDIEMYDPTQDTPALARTSNMNADLGQVEYVFSDKTGTLTQNVMKFKRCAVAGQVYGEVSQAEKDKMTPMQAARVLDAPPLTALRAKTIALGSSRASSERPPEVDFAICLAVNHTVVMEKDEATGKSKMQCESPDEEALVSGGALLGVEFIDRNPGEVITRYGGVEERYTLLLTVPFDSSRKRMSVVVRAPDGRTVLYCKGADNIILDRATDFAGTSEERIGVQLGVFAEDGLRTLLLARRELSNEFYTAWAEEYRAASVAVEGRAERLAEVATKIECELEVIGVTAIEDKLQDDVPNTIADLGKAGVKLWVLTGDKEETAINIGYSCRLLEPHMTLIKLKERNGDPDSVARQLEGLCAHFGRLAEDDSLFEHQWSHVLHSVKDKSSATATAHHSDPTKAGSDTPHTGKSLIEDPGVAGGALPDPLLEQPVVGGSNSINGSSSVANGSGGSGGLAKVAITSDALALVVDGPSLVHVLGDKQRQAMFLRVACMCRSVVACRVSPAQKRLIVRLVKKGVKPKPITLAIGDGANDVGMIQEAGVGVGISGKEGRQAVNNSDFAIAQFRFLRRLMLVHGHWDYRRLCKVILYSFYKNIALTFILFYYCFFTGFSGQSLYESLVYSGYNFFLALPILCVGLFDRDVDARTAVAAQKLYRIGRDNMDLNVRVAALWLGQAVLDSILIFFLPVIAYGGSAAVFSHRGYQDGLFVFGTTVYTALVLSMLLKVCTMTWTWNIVGAYCLAGSLLLYFGFILIYSSVLDWAYGFYAVGYELFARAGFWLLVIQVGLIVWCLDLFIRWLGHRWWPNIGDHAMEFDRGFTTDKGLDLLAAIKDSHNDAELRANTGNLPATTGSFGASSTDLQQQQQQQQQHRRGNSGAGSGRVVVDQHSLRKLNETVPADKLRDLGIEEGDSLFVRSSYAYDHVDTGVETAAKYDLGEEVLGHAMQEGEDDDDNDTSLFARSLMSHMESGRAAAAGFNSSSSSSSTSGAPQSRPGFVRIGAIRRQSSSNKAA